MKSLLFIQLPVPRFSFETFPTNIPLAAGFMSAALEALNYTDIRSEILEPEVTDIFADQGIIRTIIDRQPDIVAMTLYLWNVQRSLFLAAMIKQTLPGIMILLGGPEVTLDNTRIITHPAADAGIFGEGEFRIGQMIEGLFSKRAQTNIPGSFIKEGRVLHVDRTTAPLWNLGNAPYPYLCQKIGPSREGTIFLETLRGCPFTCRYCYYHKAFNGMRYHPLESVEKVLELAYQKDSGVREIYLMDPTFNARKDFKKILSSMAHKRFSKDIALHAELRADLLCSEDARLLKDAGLTTAEAGLQSVNTVVLEKTGRVGNPQEFARGVSLLKDAGIRVTTGIILGLPEDTPEGFSRTLHWLKQTGAYSEVHPFVLSVLPGTYFRSHAASLGILYDSRPPYYVRSTNTFPANDIRSSLLECETVFDMELDHISLPSFIDQGLRVLVSPDEARYISKWIVNPENPGVADQLSEIIAKGTDPFIFWFRGRSVSKVESNIISILKEFIRSNPHVSLHIIMEYSVPASPSLLQDIVDAGANPSQFLNRAYQPLYQAGEVVSPNIVMLLPYHEDKKIREYIKAAYDSFATVVWSLSELSGSVLSCLELPLLISWSPLESEHTLDALQKAFRRCADDASEEVCFRNPDFQDAWNRRFNRQDSSIPLPEQILVTV